ncbi:MAG TPA: DUF4810 domain-containing protein [Anaeromyxobacteraceae bacterium]
MRRAILTLALSALAGCATPTMYHWGAYDDTLYRYYKTPAEREAFVASLKTIVLEAEQEGRRVPPGVHAEYGFALYEEGLFDQAIVYFQKERDQWPESRVLMEKMIRNAQQAKQKAPPTPPAQGPAGALEKR